MDSTEHSRPNKSALKRAAKEVEALAEKLAGVSEAFLAELALSADLKEKIDLARRTKGHGARKRQIKHLAGLLRRRHEELGVLADFMTRIDQRNARQNRDFHYLEGLRDRLCDAHLFPEALSEVESVLPDLDLQAIHQLAGKVHACADRGAFREIFRRLRDAREKKPASDKIDLPG